MKVEEARYSKRRMRDDHHFVPKKMDAYFSSRLSYFFPLPCRYVFVIALALFTILVNDKHLSGEGNIVSMKYRKATLDNGLRVIMVEHHELPVVAIELLIKNSQ
jgi:hypothetical protein